MDVVVAPVDRAREAELHAINRESPISAGGTFFIDREPDFFAWPRATFARYQYFGIFTAGKLVGYLVAGAEGGWTGRDYRDFCYVGDARVVPAARGAGLTVIAAEHVRAALPAEVDVGFCFVKKRNVRGGSAVRSLEDTAVLTAPASGYVVHDVGAVTTAGGWARVAVPEDAYGIAALLARSYAGRLFAPRVDPRRGDLGVGIRWDRDRVWVIEDRGWIIGVLSMRDASHARVTRALSTGLRARVVAATRRVLESRVTPPRGSRGAGALRVLTATHLAAWDDDPAIARSLIVTARAYAATNGYCAVRVGFPENDPLRAAVRRMISRRHDGRIHLFARSRARLDAALACAARPYVNPLFV